MGIDSKKDIDWHYLILSCMLFATHQSTMALISSKKQSFQILQNTLKLILNKPKHSSTSRLHLIANIELVSQKLEKTSKEV